MRVSRKRWLIFIICGIPIILIAGLWLFGVIAVRQQSQEIKPWITYRRLLYVALGCDEYKKRNGAWPNSLAQLHSFRTDLNDPWTKDAWGRDVVLIPYNEHLGYGEIISYGRDGKPGGTDADRNLQVRFPTESNSEWNEQQGVGLKQPRLSP
jgi:Type II secretion system (T2SS), protein G